MIATLCTVCGTRTPRERHEFYEGDPSRPVRRWEVIATRWHAVDQDSTPPTIRIAAEFCGPICSTAWRLERP